MLLGWVVDTRWVGVGVQGSSAAGEGSSSTSWWEHEGSETASVLGLELRCCKLLQGLGASDLGKQRGKRDSRELMPAATMSRYESRAAKAQMSPN